MLPAEIDWRVCPVFIIDDKRKPTVILDYSIYPSFGGGVTGKAVFSFTIFRDTGKVTDMRPYGGIHLADRWILPPNNLISIQTVEQDYKNLFTFRTGEDTDD